MLDDAFNFLMIALLVAMATGVIFSLIRLYLGPTPMDRLVAIEFLSSVSMCALIWMGLQFSFSLVLDVALALALLGFLGTVSLARWMEKPS